MKRRILLCVSVLLCVLSVFFAAPTRAFAAGASRTVTEYPSVRWNVAGVMRDDGYLVQGTSLIPLRDFLTAAGLSPSITYSAGTRSATVTVDSLGLSLQATDGNSVVYCNGRVFYSQVPTKILSDGRMYLPARLLAKALGMTLRWDGATRTVYYDGTPSPIPTAEEYYSPDELYWLSRIISAESRGEPLLGQIAVGCVVLNRVRSPEYPNTIWGVIFDRKYGVQFSPVANGTIYATPYSVSVIAAKICLEGTTVSADILFFLEPSKSSSHWITATRTYVFTIGKHEFYA